MGVEGGQGVEGLRGGRRGMVGAWKEGGRGCEGLERHGWIGGGWSRVGSSLESERRGSAGVCRDGRV